MRRLKQARVRISSSTRLTRNPQELDAMAEKEKAVRALFEGVFAGNVFDLVPVIDPSLLLCLALPGYPHRMHD